MSTPKWFLFGCKYLRHLSVSTATFPCVLVLTTSIGVAVGAFEPPTLKGVRLIDLASALRKSVANCI